MYIVYVMYILYTYNSVSGIGYSYLMWGTVSHRLFKWHPQYSIVRYTVCIVCIVYSTHSVYTIVL